MYTGNIYSGFVDKQVAAAKRADATKPDDAIGGPDDAIYEIPEDEEEGDIFESETLPTYARSYILPRKMRRKSVSEGLTQEKKSIFKACTVLYWRNF